MTMARFRDVSDYLRILYKRRWLAGGAFILVFVYLATSSLRKTPLYEATTQVLIEKASSPESFYDADFYEAQCRALRSRALAWRTLESLGLASATADTARHAATVHASGGGWLGKLATWLGAPKAILPSAGDETVWQSARIDWFLGSLTVSPVKNSRLVSVRFLTADPVFAARATTALVEAYIAQGLGFRAVATANAHAVLATQLAEQKQKLEISERALQAYQAKHDAVALTDPANNTVVRKLADVGAELTRARGERLAKEQVFQTVRALRHDSATLASFPAVQANPAIGSLTREIADLKSQDAGLAADFGEQYQKRKDIAAQLASKHAELQSHIDRVVETIGHDYEMATMRETALAAQLEAQKLESLTQDAVAMTFVALDRDVVGNRQLYEDLLARAGVTGVTGEYKGTSAQVIERAEIPRVPILPNHERDVLVAFLTGLVLALGLAFGLDFVDSRIKSPEDIKNYLGLPFLGLIPAVRTRDVKGSSPLLDRGVPPAFSEAVRGIRTSVMFSTATEGARTIMVTSTVPSEGKTVVAANLGDALAQAEQRTLIIDGDMRRPRVHDVFGCTQEPGLSNVLVGAAELKTAIRQTGNPLLSILPAGLIPPNPAELLGSQRYRRLLEELGQEYDWIVVDAPPVMAVTDAAVIANGVGGVLFVVGSEMTPRRNAQVALEQLVAARGRLVGAVLNRVQLERHAYYYAPYYRKDYTHAYARSR
jgi:capsular exopolysaccharide synthesis family protein